MDSYKIIVTKNDKQILQSETVFPSFVGEDHSIRFATLELLTEILETHPSFFDDIYDMLVRLQDKAIEGQSIRKKNICQCKCLNGQDE